MKREHQESSGSSSNRILQRGGIGSSSSSTAKGYPATAMSSSNGKPKMFSDPSESSSTTAPSEAGVDELLAVLGYKVRSSDMADVAQKLEQLEMVMGNAQEDGLSHLSSDTVHYNPSDLSNWLETMLAEFNDPSSSMAAAAPPSNPPQFAEDALATESSTVTTVDFHHSNRNQRPYESDYDLRAIPGEIVYGNAAAGEEDEPEKKKLKATSPPESARPIVFVDSQENGIRLVHALMACGEAVQHDNLKAAMALVKQIGLLAASQAGAMRKVATYFAEALAQRIYKSYPLKFPLDASLSDILQTHFYEACPYLKFAHFTANQAILEAFAGKNRVHVIDFSMKQGMQWPALMQALALRPGGPPTFRLTGIGPPQPDNTDALQQVGWKLAQLAETIHVEFEFRGFVTKSLADLQPHMLDIRPEDVVAVNSVFELHPLLARPGAIDHVLATVKALRPTIVTIVEEEANHNVPGFLDRFNEALHYYSSMFDSLEGCGMSPPDSQDQLMSELYLGSQIFNVVACEGADRIERHETLAQWRGRMTGAGFTPFPLGSNAFKQASVLLAVFAGGDGYRVEENDGCLMLGWHTRPLIATSAWQIVERV